MIQDSKVAEICILFTELVKAMVTDPEAVKVTAVTTSGSAIKLHITTRVKSDLGKIIGKQGRTARSLRILLQSIAASHRLDLALDIGDEPAGESNERTS